MAADMRFADKVVWITGASSGIGEALVHAFRREGAHVVLSARRADELERVGRDCAQGTPGDGPGDLMVVPLDVADADALEPAALRVLERFGRVDILVNNAGITNRSLVADTDMAVYRRVMEVDFFGAVGLTKAVLPSMLERKSGHIVAVTSVAGKYSTPLRSGYNAAKAAMHGFFDSLRAEIWADGIAVTLILPGAIRTEVSINALTGDGSPYGKMNRFLEQGMPPEEFARRALDAVAQRRDEAMIASGEARRLVWMKRFLPGRAARAVRLRRRT